MAYQVQAPWDKFGRPSWPAPGELGRAQEENSFYRLWVAAYVVSTGVPIVTSNGMRVTFASMDVGTTVGMDGSRAPFLRGAPIYDVVRSEPTTRFVLAPAPSPAAERLIANILSHLPPMRRLTLPRNTPALTRQAEMRAQWMRVLPRTLSSPPLSTTTSCVIALNVSMRDATNELGAEVAAQLERNPFVRGCYVEAERLHETALNLVLLLDVDLRQASDIGIHVR